MAASLSDGTIPRLGDSQAAVERSTKDVDVSGRARRLISMGIVFWLGLAKSYTRTRPPTSGALNCRSTGDRNFAIGCGGPVEFAPAPVQALAARRQRPRRRAGRSLRCARSYLRTSETGGGQAARNAICSSRRRHHPSYRAPCGRWRGGGLSPPDRRLRSASLACGSPACPERRASRTAG